MKRTEDTLKQNEELYKNLVECLTEAVIITDIYDRVVFANKRVYELTGYSPEEIIGNVAYNLFFDPKDWAKVLEKTKLRYSDISDQYEIEILRKDRSKFWVSITGTPYKNSSGEIVGTIGAINDITKNKEAGKILENSEKKYRSVVEQVREVIFQTDCRRENFIY